MIASEQKRFDNLYQKHLRALKLHGYETGTIDVYSRGIRGVWSSDSTAFRISLVWIR